MRRKVGAACRHRKLTIAIALIAMGGANPALAAGGLELDYYLAAATGAGSGRVKLRVSV
jgi:hypothetical protein